MLLVGMQNDTATLKHFGCFFKSQTYTYHTTQKSHSWIFTLENRKLTCTQNLHANAHGSSSHNCPNWKQLKRPLIGEWMDKLRNIQTMDTGQK